MNSNLAEKFKKEDKKAFKLFAILIFIGFIVGGVIGGFSAGIDNNFSGQIASELINFISIISPFAGLVLTILVMIAAQILYRNSRNQYEIWKDKCEEDEDEEKIESIEEKLSYILLLTTINTIFAFFFFGVGSILLPFDKFQGTLSIIKEICMFGGFILCLVYTTLMQKKVVNFEKEINPILKGSIYDLKFAKKWIDSCDEALKLNIYKSAYKAYSSVNITCVVLWLFCIIGSSFWNFGIMPLAVVIIIWLVQTTTYYIESMRISKYKSNNK